MQIKTKVITGMVIAGFVVYISIFGLSFKTLQTLCPATEEILPIPSELQNVKITLEKNEYLVTPNKYNCSPILKQIDNEIFDTGTITPSEKLYTEEKRGQKVTDLSSGKVFQLDKIVSLTGHGLGEAISDGPKTSLYLILKDEDGQVYKLATALLTYDDSRAYLSFVYQNKKQYLSWKYFKNTFNLPR